LIHVNPIATASAGPDKSICSNAVASLPGTPFGGGATSGTWSVTGTTGAAGTGDGLFSFVGESGTYVYTPGENDKSQTTPFNLTITYTTNDPAGPCAAASDFMILTINPTPVPSITQAPPLVVCAATALPLGTFSGPAGANYIYQWTVSGNASIANASDQSPLVTSGAYSAGTPNFTLQLTVTDVTYDVAGCAATSDPYVVAINSLELSVTKTDVTCFGLNDGMATITATGGNPPYYYLWFNPATQTTIVEDATATGLPPGTYDAYVVDDNGAGCTVQTSITITEPPVITASAAVTSSFNGSHISCNAAVDGVITITASGGTGALAYTLSGGTLGAPVTQASGVFNGLGAGTYHFSVTDANNCEAEEGTVTITAPTVITASGEVSSDHNGSDVSCAGATDGAISVTGVGGTGTLTYTLSGGTLENPVSNTTGVFTGLGSGEYQFSVTDINSCPAAQGNVSIEEPAPINASGAVTSNFNGSPLSCASSTDGEITITANGGTSPLSYTLSGGTLVTQVTNGTGIFTGLGAGTYHFSVTDANNCQASEDDVIITAPPAVTASGAVTSNHNGVQVSCVGSVDGAITITASGGTAALVYTLSGGTLGAPVTQGSGLFNGLGAGTYHFSVTDANNCLAAQGDVIISGPAPVVVSGTITHITSCFGALDGAIDLEVTGGTGSYTYLWNNGATTQDLIGVAAGTYTVTITESNGCEVTGTTSFTINEPAVVTAAGLVTPITCNGQATGAIDLTITGGSGSYTFEWSGPGGFSATSEDISNTIAGTYTVIITESNGCTVTGETSFTINEPPAITASGAVTSDFNGSHISCAASTNGEITITASGGTDPLSYTLSGGTLGSPVTQAGGVFTGLGTGTYHFSVTDANSCPAFEGDVTIIAPAAIAATGAVTSDFNGSQISCTASTDGEITITANGGTAPLSYTVSGGTLGSPVTQASGVFTGLGAGTYHFSVTDANSCPASEGDLTITAPAAITAGGTVTSDFNGSHISCAASTDGEITITANGGTAPLNYTLSGGTLGSPVTQASGVFTGLGAGTYHFTVTDANDCPAAEGDVTIIAPAAITASGAVTSDFNGSHISCAASADGEITITASGGTAPLSYTLSGGSLGSPLTQNSAVFTGLGAGSYHFVVTDVNNCSMAEGDVAIIAPAAITASGAVTSDFNGSPVSCAASTDGGITITASGGTAPLSYTLSGGTLGVPLTQAGGLFTGLGAGTYHFSVTDVNNCTAAEGNVTITAPAAITASGAVTSEFNGSHISCAVSTDGAITITANGGAAPLSYTLNGGTLASPVTQSNGVFTGLGAGTYLFSVTDANGCPAATGNVTITAPAAITASGAVTSDFGGSHLSCAASTDGEITITAGGGTAPLSYTLSGGTLSSPVTQASGVFTGLGAGTYHFGVTDANSCAAATGDVTIIAPATITASGVVTSNYNGSQISCAASTDGSVTITASGGTAPLSYTLSGGTLGSPVTQASGVFTGLGAGTYHFNVTDANNCSMAEGDVTITAPAVITANGTVTSDHNGAQLTCLGATDGQVTITAGGGTGVLAYTLSGGTLGSPVTQPNGVFNDLGAGTYHFSVTDANNCPAAEGDVTITAPTVVSALGSVSSNYNGSQISCAASADGQITVSASGGTAPLSYTLSGGTLILPVTQPGGIFNGLGAGTYHFMVTDVNNCSASQGDVTIIAPPVISASGAVTSNFNGSHLTCANSTDGAITITASGGTAPLSYTLSGGTLGTPVVQANGVFTGLGAGTYSFSVTDINNCPASAGNVTIIAPQTITADIVKADPSCFGGTGSATITNVNGGTSPHTYEWSNAQTGVTATGLAVGNYSVEITDANGCSITLPVSISYLDVTPPLITACPNDPVTARNTDASGCSYTIKNNEFNISVTDACPLTHTYQLSGATVGSVVTASSLNGVVLQPGTTHIKWTVTDGIFPQVCEFDVTVTDGVAPVPNVTNLPDITGDCSAAVGANPPTATDNCAGPITGTTNSPLAYNTIGEHIIVWQYNDGNGNTSFQNQKVIVTDNVEPVPDVVTLPALTGQCSVTVTAVPTATDNCAGVLHATTTSPLFYNIPGQYQVVWIYDDGNGHAIIQFQNVIVTGLSTFAPTSSGSACTGGVTIGLESSQSGVSYQLVRNGSVNIGAALIGNGNALEFGTFTTAGTYSVTATSLTQGCTITMPQTVSVSSGTLPQAFTVISSGSVCTSGVTITLTSSQSGMTYNLIRTVNNIGIVEGTFTGNGGGHNFGPFFTPGVYTIEGTNTAG